MTVILQAERRPGDSGRPPGEPGEDMAGPFTAAVLRSLDPRKLLARGVRDVVVHDAVTFGADPETDVRLVRFLRESASCLLRLDWPLATPGPVGAGMLAHLPPPRPPGPGADEQTSSYVREWRINYGFGRCYYRVGPGFISIVDVRDPASAARFVLDEPAAVDAFGVLTGAVRLAGATAVAAELASQLEEAGLLLRAGGWATVLPFRLNRWPVPCTVV